MSGYQRDIGLAVKKYVGEFVADVAGRSGNCNLHGIFLLTSRRMRRVCLAFQKKAATYLESEVSKAARMSTGASLGPDEIDEYAPVVVPQVGQVVGEVGEVVADANLQILAHVMIDGGKDAAAALIDIWEPKRPRLGQALPLLEEPPVHTKHCELRRVFEEVRNHAVQAHLSQPVGVLAAHGPVGCDVIGKIERRDVALLQELGRGLLQSQLIRGRYVIEVRVLDQGVQPVVPHRPVSVADHGLGVAAAIEVAERAVTDRVVQLAD